MIVVRCTVCGTEYDADEEDGPGGPCPNNYRPGKCPGVLIPVPEE